MLTLIKHQLTRLWLVAFLFGVEVVFVVLYQSQSVDQTQWTGAMLTRSLLFDANWFGSFYRVFLICLFALPLLTREEDDRTIEFLDALPVSRGQVLVAKFIAGLMVLCVTPLVVIALYIMLHPSVATSLDPAIQTGWLVAYFKTFVLQMSTFLSVGLLLSFARVNGLLGLAVVIMFAYAIGENDVWFDPSKWSLFAGGTSFGASWIWANWLTKIYLSVLGVSFLGTYILFSKRTQGIRTFFSRSFFVAGTVCLWGMVSLMLLAIAGKAALSAYRHATVAEEVSSSSAESVDDEAFNKSVNTKYFRVVYPSSKAARAKIVLDRADQIHQQVTEFFSHDLGEKLHLDMTAPASYVEGVAEWKSISMTLAPRDPSPERLYQVLAHELTHVVLAEISDTQLSEHFSATRVFHEGVASYVQYKLYGTSEPMDHRFVAAVMAHRKLASLDLLFDWPQLERHLQVHLVYELGEVFAAAIDRTLGAEAFAKLAKTFTDLPAEVDFGGTALWRYVFAKAGYRFTDVEDAYYALLEEAITHHQDRIQEFRFEQPQIFVQQGTIVILFPHLPPDGWKQGIRLRVFENSTKQQTYTRYTPNKDVLFKSLHIVNPAIWYSLQYSDGEGNVISDRWQTFVRK